MGEGRSWRPPLAKSGRIMDVASYDLLSTAVLLLNDQGRVEHANTAAEELFSVSRKQLAGQLVDALFDEDAALAERLPDAINGKFGILSQDLTIDRWGDQVSVSLAIVPLHRQIGRESCRERVCPVVAISVVAGS